jgi:hypothetical protein
MFRSVYINNTKQTSKDLDEQLSRRRTSSRSSDYVIDRTRGYGLTAYFLIGLSFLLFFLTLPLSICLSVKVIHTLLAITVKNI